MAFIQYTLISNLYLATNFLSFFVNKNTQDQLTGCANFFSCLNFALEFYARARAYGHWLARPEVVAWIGVAELQVEFQLAL